MKNLTACTFIVLATGIVASCGEDPGMYKNETLTFTTPVNAKMGQKDIEEEALDLKDQNSSNFIFRRIGAMVPWAPMPIFDYYREPLPLEVPVSPFYSLIEWVPPMYAPYFMDDWGGDWGGGPNWDDDE